MPARRSMAWVIGSAVVVAAAVVAILSWPTPSRPRAAPARAAAASPRVPDAPATSLAAALPTPTSPPGPPAPAAPLIVQPAVASPAPDSGGEVARGSCSLHIEADAPGSVVLIEGRVVGEAPRDIEGLYCGHRTRVAVVNARFAPWQRWLVPEEGKPLRLRADLRRFTTAIAVTSAPAGAMVRVNGNEVTTTPAAIPVVANVPTTIEVSLPGYASFEKRLVPRAGTTETIDAALRPAAITGR